MGRERALMEKQMTLWEDKCALRRTDRRYNICVIMSVWVWYQPHCRGNEITGASTEWVYDNWVLAEALLSDR